MNETEPNLVFVSHFNDGSDEDPCEENSGALHSLESRKSPRNKEIDITRKTAKDCTVSNGTEERYLSQNSETLANNDVQDTDAFQRPPNVASTNDAATSAFVPCLQFHDNSNHEHQISDGSFHQMETTEDYSPETETNIVGTVDGTVTNALDMAVEGLDRSPAIISNESENTNVNVEPILIVPTGESQSSLESGLPTHPDLGGNTDAVLTMDTLLMNVQPIMIEPLSDDSDMDDNMDFQSGDIIQSTENRLTDAHFKRKKRPKRLSCFKCKKKFTGSVDLLKHKELYCPKKRFHDNNVKIPQFTCLKCNYRSNGRTSLTTCILHTKIHDKLKYSCQECGVTFKWWNSVLRHWKDYHNTNEENGAEDEQEKEPSGDKDLTCDTLTEAAGSETNNSSAFFCSKCNKNFLSDYQLSKHLPSCWHSCCCGFMDVSVRSCLHHMMNCFAMNTSLLWFRRNHEVVRPWTIPCPGCPFETNREEQLIEHLNENEWHKEVTEANPVYMNRYGYTCPICFHHNIPCSRTESQLLCAVFHHMKRHHTALFRCYFCIASCHDMSILKRHVEIKHREKPICTCLYCGRIFTTSGTALMHMYNHQRHTIYCQKCYWAFEDRFRYQSHMQSHHLPSIGMRFQCHMCPFSTVHSYEILEHRKQHVHLKLKCRMCNGLFFAETHLKRHEKLHFEGKIVPKIIPTVENGEIKGLLHVYEKAEEDNNDISSTVDSHNEEENQVVISPQWIDPRRILEKKPSMKQETAQFNSFVDRAFTKTSNCTHPIYHEENLPDDFNRIREIRGRMFSTKAMQGRACPCFLCNLHFPSTDYLVSHLQSRHGDTIHVSLCNPETVAVTFSRQNLCFTLCIGCKVCANSSWSGENRVFASMEKFEEHCSLYHPRTSNTDDIECQVPGCTYISYGEIRYYTHLADSHRNKIQIRIENPSRLRIYYEHKHSKPISLGERSECCMCRKVFFSQAQLQFHIVSHEKRTSSKHHSLACQIVKVLRNQPLTVNIANALVKNPLVVNKERLQVRRDSRKHPGMSERFIAVRYSSTDTDASSRVRISLYRHSKGKEAFIRGDSGAGDATQNDDDDADMPCQVCEKSLGVQMPRGLCVHCRQPLVTLNKNELRKYMLDRMLSSNLPLPRWYRLYAESSNWFMGWDAPKYKREPKRNISKANRNTTKTKFPKNVSDNSPIWLKYCRKCYKLYEVFVLLEMCVHKKFIIVSLVNPSDADRANASLYCETITTTNAEDSDPALNKSTGNVDMELGTSESGQEDNVRVFNGVPSTENSTVIKTEKVHDLTSTFKNDIQNETNVEMATDTLKIVGGNWCGQW